jgi:hypothetical protein
VSWARLGDPEILNLCLLIEKARDPVKNLIFKRDLSILCKGPPKKAKKPRKNRGEHAISTHLMWGVRLYF